MQLCLVFFKLDGIIYIYFYISLGLLVMGCIERLRYLVLIVVGVLFLDIIKQLYQGCDFELVFLGLLLFQWFRELCLYFLEIMGKI